MDQQRLWGRDFTLAFGINLAMSMTFYMLMTSMAGYAVDRFGAGETVAGLASSSFVIGALVARVFAGKFLDFVGRRRLILLSLIVFVIAGALYIPLADVWSVIAVRFIHGLAFGAGNTALTASVQSLIPSARRAEGTGYFGTSTSLSTALGPFLAVLLAQDLGYMALFTAGAVFAACGLLLALFIRLPERTPGPEEIAAKWRFSPSSFIDHGALRISAVMFLAGLAYSIVLAFLASHASALGAPRAASIFFIVFAAVMLVSRLFVGRLQDRFGDNAVVYPILLMFCAGFALIALAGSGWTLVIAAVPMGLGFGSLFPSVQAIAVEVTPRERVGLAISTFFIMLDLGTGVGPVILGAAATWMGLSGVYWLCAGIVVITAGVYWAVHGRTPQGRARR